MNLTRFVRVTACNFIPSQGARYPGTGWAPAGYGPHMSQPSPAQRSPSSPRGLGHAPLDACLIAFVMATCSLSPARITAQDDRAYQVLEDASKHYQGIKTLCADFRQVIEVTLLKESRSGEGTICQLQPDKFSMRFKDPEGDVVIVDGVFLWTFYPSMDDKQVMRFQAAGAEGRFNFYKNFLVDPRGRFRATYEGQENPGSELSHKISIAPKEPSGFRTATVWISLQSRLITAVDIHDANESVRKIRLTHIRLDLDLPETEFLFVPPPGARIITG